ncbi:MAG: hypothetical protein QOC99_357 [Acidobacteriota bacterium]|jgi:hypothetical protein|nr:hypothetical protein [Acidobacteriota bacterium]
MRRLNIWKRVAIGIAVVMMLAMGAIWESRRARAFNPQPDPPRYTMVGIVRGQSIRINASNIAPSDPNSPPDPCVPSVEVIDNATFKTSFVYAGTPSFSDPPEPDRQQ